MTAMETLCMLQAFGGEDFQVEEIASGPEFTTKLVREAGDQIRYVTCNGVTGFEVKTTTGTISVWPRRPKVSFRAQGKQGA